MPERKRRADTTIEESKGWMSPSGKASPVGGQHAYEHHPEIAREIDKELKAKFPKAGRNLSWEQKSKSVGMAQHKGYARYGREGNLGYSYVHYDKDSPGGKEAALHALGHLKPRFGETIRITNKGEYVMGADHKFNSPGEAAHHIRNGGATQESTKMNTLLTNILSEANDFDNRTRFNWGYHEGAAHHHKGGSTKDRNGLGTKMDKSHFDQVYTKGFHKGFEDSQAGNYDHSSHGTTTSDAAWKDTGLKNGTSLKPHKLMGKDQKGKKIAPWMQKEAEQPWDEHNPGTVKAEIPLTHCSVCDTDGHPASKHLAKALHGKNNLPVKESQNAPQTPVEGSRSIAEASRIKYSQEMHGGLERHGYKRDNNWASNGHVRIYRHPSGSKVMTHGNGLGKNLHWTHWDQKYNTAPVGEHQKYEKSGSTTAALTKHLNKMHAKPVKEDEFRATRDSAPGSVVDDESMRCSKCGKNHMPTMPCSKKKLLFGAEKSVR